MLELNKWFFVLAANFFLLLILLHYLLYKPLLQKFKEREDTVQGSLDAAKNMGTKKEETISKLNRELADARSKAKEIFEILRAEGLQKQKEVVSQAESEASGIIEKTMADIRAETEKARNTLRAEVDKFSDEILRKLVKV